jgi:hypothetical protein
MRAQAQNGKHTLTELEHLRGNLTWLGKPFAVASPTQKKSGGSDGTDGRSGLRRTTIGSRATGEVVDANALLTCGFKFVMSSAA